MLSLLSQRGYPARIVSTRFLQDLEGDIEAQHRAGCFDERFYRERLTGFAFDPPEHLAHTRSLIVVAVRQPQVRFTFTYGGRRMPVVVPPTYLHWRETDRRVETLLSEALAPEGYHLAQASLPKKLLSVRSGLAEYGRNNVTYVPGMGSFHRLTAFYSDLPCEEEEEEETWLELRMMERCETCRACLRHCPSGAITDERFLLQAERCIVFHNEQPGDVPFPDWMAASWHNALVGCMRCQTVCPQNEDVLPWIEDAATFSSEETARLLAGASLDQLPAETASKLKEHDLADLIDILPRNLRVLFERIV